MAAPTQPAFVDWTSADPLHDRATGFLGDVRVELEGELGNSFISNEYNGYGSDVFTPPLPLSDAVEVRSTPGSAFRLTFDPPVQDPILDIASLASDMTFTHLPHGATVIRRNGDPDFEVVTGDDTVKGQHHEAKMIDGGILATDSNGTIQISATAPCEEIRFTLTPNFTASVPDGVLLQIGGPIARPAFVDWTSADPLHDRATGFLGDVRVELEGELGNSFISNEYNGYGSDVFTPPLPLSDAVEVRSTPGSAFRLTFDPPVQDPILQIASLASDMTFTHLPHGATVTKKNGDPDFEVVTGDDTVKGQHHEAKMIDGGILATDSNGTIQITATAPCKEIRFTLTPNFPANVPDGVLLQIGRTPH